MLIRGVLLRCADVARRTSIYPYEMLELLEEFHRARFTGTATLEADGARSVLYVSKGTVRYARTTRLMGTFPAYLLTERIFHKSTLKAHLEKCTDDGISLERYLLDEDVLSPEDLRYLKRDLARSIFSRSFALTATVEVQPTARRTPEYRQPPMDPFLALFTAVNEDPSREVMEQTLAPSLDRKLERGPEFFALLASFRSVFGRSKVTAMLDRRPTLRAIIDKIRDRNQAFALVFALYKSGMVAFEGEVLERSPLRMALATTKRPRAAEETAPRSGKRKRTNTQPGIGGQNQGHEDADEDDDLRHGRKDVITQPGIPIPASVYTAGPDPRKITQPQASALTGEEIVAVQGGPRPTTDPSSTSELSLRDILVGESIIGAAGQAEAQDFYHFFGVGLDAPFSALRAAYMKAWNQYDTGRFDEYQLSAEALAALERVQERIEIGYETLTEPRRRWEHNREFGLDTQVEPEQFEALFEAERLFEAAQEHMTRGDSGMAAQLLDEAARLNRDEPEYLAYLAWAVVCASMWGQRIPEGLEEPHHLLARALDMDPQLESAWVFKARLAELSGHLEGALAAFLEVLDANPENQEAMQAVQRLSADGVTLSTGAGGSLEDRLDRLMRRFAGA